MKTIKEMACPVPVNGGLEMEGYWVWDGGVVKGEDGKYHMFASRVPKPWTLCPGGFYKSEIIHAISDTPYGPFQFYEVVFPARGPEYWDGRATFNPQVRKVGDTYVMYYVGTTYINDVPLEDQKEQPNRRTALSHKRVGVAYSKSVYGPWERSDYPLLVTRPGCGDSLLTSNPTACVNENGNVLMVYKGRNYDENRAGRVGLMRLLYATGKDSFSPLEREKDNELFPNLPEKLNNPYVEVEDPFIWYDNGYHIMTKDMTGAICGEKYAGFHAFSKDGKDWTMDREVFYSRTIQFDNGEERRMGNMERPFLLFEDGKPICAYFSVTDATDEQGFMSPTCTKSWVIAVPLNP